MKSILGMRPVFHQSDEAIRGHVFCSFLALLLRTELHDRPAARGEAFEWAELLQDLDALEEVDVAQGSQRFVLRSEVRGCAGKVLQAVGVALPAGGRHGHRWEGSGRRQRRMRERRRHLPDVPGAR